MPYGTDPVILGTAPAGSDGDTAREAFTKVDAALNEVDDYFDGTAPIPAATIESATVERIVMASDTLTYGATVDIDFNADTVQNLALTGNVTFTTSNKAAGKTVTLFVTCDGTNRTLTFPAWEFFSEEPTEIAANEEAVITLYCKGSADTDVRAAYAVTGGGSPVTTTGTQTLTNKTLTSPVITTPTGLEMDDIDGLLDSINSLETQLDDKAAKAITVKVTSGNYTVGTTSALELYGGIIYVTGAATITIPAVTAGQSFTVVTVGAVAVSVDPNASDLIMLDGTALSDGDKITNLSTSGDIAVFTYYDATGWYAATNGWTDGN